MTISFRTRLFVIASLIVAAVLATVMVMGWSRVLSFEVERLDSRLCTEARRLAHEPFHGDEIPSLEADLMGKLRLTENEQLMLRFESTGGEPEFQSTHWSDGLGIDALAWTAARREDESVRPERARFKAPAQKPKRPEPPDRQPSGACSLTSFTASGTQWRAALFTVPTGRSFLAVDLAATEAELQGALRGALTIVIPLALALAALGAWLLSSLTMRPVNRLREAMAGVTQKALDQRLPTAGEDREFRELIGAYNTMLARLEASFRQASRFSADAAHELRTPLTILQGRIEQALSRSEHGAMHDELADMLEEVGRLATIVRKLLLLSQADAGRLALNLAPVDLTEMLDGLMADAQMFASGQKVSSAIERQLVAQGDALLLRQLLNNLLSNAVRYCLPGGWIKVVGRRLPAGIEVIFANASAPIAAEDRLRFFDRFYRGDPAHGRNVDGSGLGLSLAREIARAHGGDLTLESSAQDEVRLRLWLPQE
jgi:heavy metal sensor kinase